jgi:molybdate transport system substrate-binding protein
MHCARLFALAITFGFSALSAQARAAELKILSPGATESALNELVPRFERSSAYHVTVQYGPVGVLADRVRAGEAADITILSEPASAALQKQGKLVAGSEAIIAKVGIGIFVRKGDPKPDIGSVQAFRHALEEAKSIAYADPTLGGSTSLLERDLVNSLDTDGAIKAKTKLVAPAKPLLDLIAGGGADFGFNPIAEIFPDPRVEYVGPVPGPLQRYTRYVAALVATSQQPQAFKTFIAFLASPDAVAVMKAKGFEQP